METLLNVLIMTSILISSIIIFTLLLLIFKSMIEKFSGDKKNNEISNKKLYREFQVNYDNFNEDTNNARGEIDTNNLMEKAKVFFKRNGLLLNWREFEKLDPAQKINTLSMIAPITNEEKQKLLETISLENKISTLDSIIGFYLHETNFNNQTVQ